MCYTYDQLDRVVVRSIVNLDNNTSTSDIYEYDAAGNVTDTFAYDTYGKLISRTGSSFVIFGYNGRDGVVTDKNGLIYMRAPYYSPEMKRFINADIVAGNAVLATVLASCAVAETVITVGTGIYNDWPVISYAISQWINYNNVATDNLATVY